MTIQSDSTAKQVESIKAQESLTVLLCEIA